MHRQSSHPPSEPPSEPRDAAAYWFARAHSGSFSEDERYRLQQWRQANRQHEQEYRALETVWQASRMIPEDELRSLLAPTQRTTAFTQRRRLLVGGAVCSVAAVGLAAVTYWPSTPEAQEQFATSRGELRSVSLPDGSTLYLNTDTVASFQLWRRQRVLQLLAGEVMLQTVADEDRPFFVNTQLGSASADATAAFSVRQNDGQMRLAVESGSAELSLGPWWRKRRLLVAAGMEAGIRGQTITAADHVDVAAATAWRYGKLVFKDQPLEEIVREISRYLPQSIRVTDSRISQLRMAGVFNLKDADGFLNALRRITPIKVTRRADGGVDIAQAA